MRRLRLLASIATLFSTILITQNSALAQSMATFRMHGYISSREIYVSAPPSWTTGGFGRLDTGSTTGNDHRTVDEHIAQVGFDWTPSSWFLVHADGLARKEPSGTKGSRGGLVEAWADLHNDHWRLRAGTFWLPTSRENVEPLWASPYTISFSALNSWIAQEVRPVGVDLQYSPNFYVTAGVTALRGNDTMGTELASHGWTVGNRIAVYDEDLPLSGETATTRPVGRDLDGKTGYSERLRIQLPERARIQFTHIDNRAELIPQIDGQVPWATRFNVISADAGAAGPTTLAAEWAAGSTSVGFPGGSFTLDFDTAYVLVSRKRGPDRWTLRVERFSTHSAIPPGTGTDYGSEDGNAVAVAWLRDVNAHSRVAVEYLRVRGERPGSLEQGFALQTGGSTITLDLRYAF